MFKKGDLVKIKEPNYKTSSSPFYKSPNGIGIFIKYKHNNIVVLFNKHKQICWSLKDFIEKLEK